ncbi:MAG TPA: CHRD domain-containing protein [Pyrinomonadaceae bacterium]|nr:CHRD domain-containing protein [Pyrinomonadaceae bacterium]
MKKIQITTLLVTLSLLAFSLTFGFNPDDNDKLFTTLSGAAEVPGPGDADGTGTADITLHHDSREVCFDLKISNIGSATMAHIHKAAAGKAGDVVVTLTPLPNNKESHGCVKNVDKDLIKNMKDNPADFYVNVHTAEFPDGAIRGQLSQKK